MKKQTWAIVIVIGAGWLATTARSQERAQETVDTATISAIREEGLKHPQVMDTVSWLADVYGPRLTGSPALTPGRRLGAEENGRMGSGEYP